MLSPPVLKRVKVLTIKPKQQFANARTLMVQGTTSDAGKTFAVAAICRLLARSELSVVPFKPQNMALNSAVTKDGGEIGRAQALQAQACYLDASVDMNPILLKPASDTGAQVIVHGKALTDMEAAAYHDYKKVAMQAVLESHQRLNNAYDYVIVEGAGSPAEINLRDGDIANMGFAEAVDCPVLLIADIDRGGVFAQIVGTLALLSESERARVVGFIINRFRGDIALLQSGLDWLEAKTGIPVLGVIPYLPAFYLDAEDAIDVQQVVTPEDGSLLPRRLAGRLTAGLGRPLQVVVPVTPRISNHTDFDALRLHPDVNLTFVGPGQKPPACDLIILSGTKNVRADCQWLIGQGWRDILCAHLRYGGKIMGICGGYQMLGACIADPDAIEDVAGDTQGLHFLPITTRLYAAKQLRRRRGQLHGAVLFNSYADGTDDAKGFDDSDGSGDNGGGTVMKDSPPVPQALLSSVDIRGYEIHCGVSTMIDYSPVDKALIVNQPRPLMTFDDGEGDGMVSDDGLILGTYLHGLFDCPDAQQMLLRWAGLNVEAVASDIHVVRERDLNRAADCFAKHLDLAQLSELLGCSEAQLTKSAHDVDSRGANNG